MVDPKALKITPKPSRELPAGALVDGRYRVVRTLGAGGTAVVYEVEHAKTGRRLALKVLGDASQAARLEQEAKAAAKLRTRHAVRVVDFGVHASSPYLVMSLLEGTSLRDLLAEKKRLDLATVANIVLQVCECLDEAHQLGLVHRDLKPDNIHLRPLTKDPASPLFDVTVLDFGVVKMPYDDAATQLTRTGSTVGTPFYMSLEQLRGAASVDGQSDVYSLSVMLYECFTGGVPFQAATLGDLVFAICSSPPVSLKTVRPELPAKVADVVMAGLASAKTGRPKSMREVAEAFRPYADAAFSLWLRGEHQPAVEPSRIEGEGDDADPTRALDRDAVEKKIAERTAKPAGDEAKAETPRAPATDPPTTTRPIPGPRVPLAPRAPGAPKLPPKPGELPKIEPPRIGPPKIEPPKIGPPKIEPPKIEPPKIGPPKIEPPKAGDATAAKPADPDSPLEEPTTTTDDREPRAAARDRDTPTEMFVKDVHGRVGPPALLDEVEPAPESGGAYPTMNLDAAPADSGEATAVIHLPLVPSPSAPFAAAPSDPETSSLDAPRPSMPGAPAPTFGTPSQPFVAAGGASSHAGFAYGGGYPNAQGYGGAPSSGGPHGAGYGWQASGAPSSGAISSKSDGTATDALGRASQKASALAARLLVMFRAATPAQQALVVGIAAAIGAVFLVTLVFLIFF